MATAKDKQKTLIKDYQTKDIMSIDLSASQSVIDAQVKAIKDKADVLINTINAAITVEEVLAVVW